MRVLITGITGFAGKHLAEFLNQKKNVELYGLSRSTQGERTLEYSNVKSIVYDCDIENSESVYKALQEIKPERIYHLAAQSFVPGVEEMGLKALKTNIIGTLNILNVVKELGLAPRIHIAGSGEAYGIAAFSKGPLKEAVLAQPVTLYGVSKLTQGLLGAGYQKSHGLWVVETRAFNHTGPGQKDLFVASNFARQVALIEAGKQAPFIQVGNLKAIRDFTDVRDVVRAYWLALEKGEAGQVYNICSGAARSINELLDVLLKNSCARIKVKVDKKKLRKLDISRVVGSASKFRKQTGWKPEITFKETLLDLLNDWRAKIRAGSA